jgi:AraC-like DNA-binding protein
MQVKEIVNMALNKKHNIKDEPIPIHHIQQNEKLQNLACDTPEQKAFIENLFTILDENLDRDDLNTPFIAEKMNISARQYYRRFKEISSLSSSDFIKSYRLEKAAEYLRETNWSIQDVINKIGIQSRAYFYKEFASRYGVTPKSYRQQMQNKESSK